MSEPTTAELRERPERCALCRAEGNLRKSGYLKPPRGYFHVVAQCPSGEECEGLEAVTRYEAIERWNHWQKRRAVGDPS